MPDESRVKFVEELWQHLIKDTRVLVETRLLSPKNEVLSGCQDAHQIDGDILLISAAE
ncbi:hypothetical protein [Prosthecobacter sp.]|uniref:hypothetical protein n=1 Tax=Prosthecobacter sp. TaxID=1965333 RepID=UPI003783E8B5